MRRRFWIGLVALSVFWLRWKSGSGHSPIRRRQRDRRARRTRKGPLHLNRIEAPVDFETQIAPIILRRCSGCHNPSDNAGGLNLLSLETALAGGKSGEPAIKPSDIDDSYVITRLEAGEMPPAGKGNPPTPEEVATLKRWIETGAAWPKNRVLSQFELTTDTRAGRDWWALERPVRPVVPAVKNAAWVRTPIDAFVLAKLEAAGLEPSPEADRATLVRRATLDVLGLPPTPEEVRQFVADRSPDAYERLIDRLLASPHYGECWGRHWLDVMRFAESDGKETNQHRDNAWPYRDYVIQSLNADKPYTQFIIEQLAGDQVGAGVATGFLVAGATDVVKSPDVELDADAAPRRLGRYGNDDGAAFLGLTVGCAKCHDHKFDPISQHDYYALQAIFAGVQHGEREIQGPGSAEIRRQREQIQTQIAAAEQARASIGLQSEPLAQVGTRSAPVAKVRPRVHALGNVDRFAPVEARFVRFTVRKTNNLEPCIDELEIFSAGPQPHNVALASAGGIATASGVYANGSVSIHQLSHINDGKFGNSWSWISNETGRGSVQIELHQPTSIDRVAWARDREGSFNDRLPIDYSIEVAMEPGKWQVVATSDDRHPYQAGAEPEEPSADQLPPAKAAERKELDAKIASLEKQLSKLRPKMVYAGVFEKPETTYRLYRGEPMQRREEVNPGAIAAVGRALAFAPFAPDAERRFGPGPLDCRRKQPAHRSRDGQPHLALPFWPRTDAAAERFRLQRRTPFAPSVARLAGHGVCGRRLAVKSIHRLILLSSTYRQASTIRPEAAAIDGADTLLWRFRTRRLPAETIRDSILAVSGELGLDDGRAGLRSVRAEQQLRQGLHSQASIRPGRLAADGLSEQAPDAVRFDLRGVRLSRLGPTHRQAEHLDHARCRRSIC